MQKFVIILLLVSASLFAQTAEEQKTSFGIKFSGFVKTDVMWDSRQTITIRDGHFLFYPAKEALDENGDDINAVPTFNMLAIQTRLRGTISAPDVFGAKTSGVIEGAFFGHSNGDLNGFRLRHAFMKLAWENSSLLIGQYWHPMFIVEVFPGTISFNTGSPFQPFSRNPQIRYTHGINNIHVSITALTQADFRSTGPVGYSTTYLRNSGLPIIDLSLKYKSEKLVAGAGANYKTLLPRLTEQNAVGIYKADKKVTSMSAMGYVKVIVNGLTIKAEGVYGQNLYDLLMLGAMPFLIQMHQALSQNILILKPLPAGQSSFTEQTCRWVCLPVTPKTLVQMIILSVPIIPGEAISPACCELRPEFNTQLEKHDMLQN